MNFRFRRAIFQSNSLAIAEGKWGSINLKVAQDNGIFNSVNYLNKQSTFRREGALFDNKKGTNLNKQICARLM